MALSGTIMSVFWDFSGMFLHSMQYQTMRPSSAVRSKNTSRHTTIRVIKFDFSGRLRTYSSPVAVSRNRTCTMHPNSLRSVGTRSTDFFPPYRLKTSFVLPRSSLSNVMLTDTKLRSQVDALWDKLWSGGLSNPLDAIEQLSFLFFLKRLDEREQDAERAAKTRGKKFTPLFPTPELRWSHWTQLPGGQGPQARQGKGLSLHQDPRRRGRLRSREQMENAEFKINKPSLLIEACKAIDEMQISAQNQDVQGDLYEYLLSKLNTAGQNGQFRTPRHIIRMMVQMLDPQPGRAHLRSGRRHLRLPRQRLAAPPRNAHRPARPHATTRRATRTA